VDDFIKGINFFIVCPGARNQSFLKIEGIDDRLDFHFDERAAAFEALGHSKLTNKPCAVVTTSGTAVGETLPAIMEAYHSNSKLVVISYDRPDRLKEVYSPQTTHQEKCLIPYVRSTSIEDDLYPKHINIKTDLENKTIFLPKCKRQYPLFIISENSFMTNDQYAELSERECFIHQELSSPFFHKRTESEVLDDDHLDRLYLQGLFGQIIRIGLSPNCGIWRKLERTKNPPEILHMTQDKYLGLSFGKRIPMELTPLMNEIRKKEISNLTKNRSSEIINNFPRSELYLLKRLIELNDRNETIFYFGNSLTIRNVKHCYIKQAQIEISRGLNGIDGQVSTALGIAKATNKNVIAVVGDQTFMYDANVLFREMPSNFNVYIINNGGGEIFKKFSFDARMANSHDSLFTEKIKLPKNVHEIQVDKLQNQKLWEKLHE